MASYLKRLAEYCEEAEMEHILLGNAPLRIPRFSKRRLGKPVSQYAGLCGLDGARTRTRS